MTTDREWEKWGQQDPYFGVLTCERFRSTQLDVAARAEFFASGHWHAQCVLASCRHYIDSAFAPRRILDFGCGVGRVLIPFAAVAEHVVGVDVSMSMLAEARRNCAELGLANVQLVLSDDDLSQVQGEFDLVHSAIVLQHIEVPRGRSLFRRLIDCLAPGGVAALQLTYGKSYHPDTLGQPASVAARPAPQPTATTLSRLLRRGAGAEDEERARTPETPAADPAMQMNPYNLSEIAYLMQTAGIRRFHAEFTDHGGELGAFLYFQRPEPTPGE